MHDKIADLTDSEAEPQTQRNSRMPLRRESNANGNGSANKQETAAEEDGPA
jgi:hypothetical protein